MLIHLFKFQLDILDAKPVKTTAPEASFGHTLFSSTIEDLVHTKCCAS